MQDLIDGFDLINSKQHMTTMECMVDHIHLDNNYIQHTLPYKGTICDALLTILFNM
jgi:hypothetical protein